MFSSNAGTDNSSSRDGITILNSLINTVIIIFSGSNLYKELKKPEYLNINLIQSN